MEDAKKPPPILSPFSIEMLEAQKKAEALDAREEAAEAAKVRGKVRDWIPLVAAAMTIVRLGPDAAPIPWPWKVRLEANEKLIKALQSGLVRSAGLYNCFGQLRFIPATDWKTLRPVISRNMLVPWGPGHRRFDWIVRIVANPEDIRREFTNEPSIVALEQPSEKPKHRGGRPAIYDWEAYEAEALRLMDLNKDFSPKKKHWNVQARLADKLIEFGVNTFGEEPTLSTLQKKIPIWVERWRSSKREPDN